VNRPTIGRRPAPPARRLALLVLLAAVILPGCGKKGPPLPPFARVPARPEQFLARRLGSTVFLQVKIPTVNADGTSPASIERIDVYGYTGTPDGNEGIFKEGTLVASIPVRKPPEGESASPSKGGSKKPAKPEDQPPAPPRPPPSMENGFDQGDVVVVTEPLGPAQFTEVVPKKKKKTPKVVEPTVKPGPSALGPAPRAPLPSRLYIAVGISRKGQKGAVSGRQSVLLTAAASAPGTPDVTYSEAALTIAWTPPGDAYAPAPGSGAGSPLRSTPIGTLPITGAFNVYEVLRPLAAPGSSEGVGPTPGGVMPTPVNEKPVPAPPFVDKRMEFGKARCYAVRAVTLFGTQPLEGEVSPTTCVTPVDTFAPGPPASLKAVGSEGAISLVWDANTESDLAGYVVMRAPLPGGEFTPVTAGPIKEATFNDTTAAKGVRYAYVVVAVDAAGNRSLKSNQVEESAR
jgi:hypothetical protein